MLWILRRADPNFQILPGGVEAAEGPPSLALLWIMSCDFMGGVDVVVEAGGNAAKRCSVKPQGAEQRQRRHPTAAW